MVFEKLSAELQKAVAKRFKSPTATQEAAIPPIAAGENTMVIAQTGTGKTESALLPIIDFITQQKTKPISALYITPLKSLNRDLLDRIMWWAEQTGIEVSVRHGDTSQYERKMQLEFPPHLMICTLETLQPLLTAKRFREHLRNVKWIVLDEVHEIADSKRGVQLAVGLERLKELCTDFQIVMLSATVGDPQKVADFFSGGKNVKVVKADTSKKTEITVVTPKPEPEDESIARKVFAYNKESATRLRVIMQMIKESRSTLVFTNTREFAEVLSSRIKTMDKDFPVSIHHSSLSKDVRIKAEKDFKEERIKALISTSSLQLGIDIGTVDLVLQYMSPRQISQLVQRVGRSGHELSKVSKGILIATDEDDVFESAVIARKALAGEMEPITPHEKSADVLAHQIIGITMDIGEVETERAYNIVKKSWPYRDLTYPEFLEVCKLLDRLGLLWVNEKSIKRRARALDYYFTNLSTIPNIKQYRVFNMLDNSFVGVLDEEFIALHGNPDTTFILKGEPYRIVSTETDKVMVEPSKDIEAAIPGWEGDLIPVPYDVAQEVGKLRKNISDWLDAKDESEVLTEMQKLYPVDEASAKKMISFVKKQKKWGAIPDNASMLVEEYEDSMVIHSCFGTNVNETLGRFLAYLLTSRVGSVGLRVDPYRIVLEFQRRPDREIFKDTVMSTKPEHLMSYIELALSKTELFEWKFIHVAKRFGAIARGADYGKFLMKRIVEDYMGTPIYKETLRELETEKLDMHRSEEILGKIQDKTIPMIFEKGLSPIGKAGIAEKLAEVVGPEKPDAEILEVFKKRLMESKLRFTCTNCMKWSQVYKLGEVTDDLKCGNCGARTLAINRGDNLQSERLIKKGRKPMSDEQKRMLETLKEKAELFLVYKRRAAIALAAHGVGPTTAKRVLSRWHKDEDSFIRSLLEAERQFMKTKKFWAAK